MADDAASREDPNRALCYHALLAAACAAGCLPECPDREWRLARGLAEMAVVARNADAFIASLASIRDPVTARHLVTQFITSPDHAICHLLEDMLVEWLSAATADPTSWERALASVRAMHVDLVFVPRHALSVADVFTYAAPLAGAFVPDCAGSYPVCTDACAVELFKKFTLLLYVVQYHDEHTQKVREIEAFVQASVRAGDGDGAWWEGICTVTCPLLWTCLKLDIEQLAEVCAAVQSDVVTWRAVGLEPVYTALGVERMLGGSAPEGIENEYVSIALADLVAKLHCGQKIMKPTASQRAPYMRLLAVQMRMLRMQRADVRSAEHAYPGWTAAAQIPPYSLRDVVARAAGRGIVVQDAGLRHSYALGRSSAGQDFFAAEMEGFAARGPALDFDALVRARAAGAFWRATIVAHDAAANLPERVQYLRELLTIARVQWVPGTHM